MPSTIIANPLLSGPQLIISGNVWSGQGYSPVVGGIQFKVDQFATQSGAIYLGFSGSLTITSGGFFMSGGGLADGFQLCAGQAYFVPKIKFPISGQCTVWARQDQSMSGVRLFWETFTVLFSFGLSALSWWQMIG